MKPERKPKGEWEILAHNLHGTYQRTSQREGKEGLNMAERKPSNEDAEMRKEYHRQLAEKDKRIKELETPTTLAFEALVENNVRLTGENSDLKAEIEDLEGGEVVSKKKYDDLKAKIAEVLTYTRVGGLTRTQCQTIERIILKGGNKRGD